MARDELSESEPPNPFDLQPVGTVPGGNHIADRVLQRRDLAKRLRHALDRGFRQRQPVDEGRLQALSLDLLQVFGIGGQDVILCVQDGFGHGLNSLVLGIRPLPHWSPDQAWAASSFEPCSSSSCRPEDLVTTRSSRCTMAARPA